MAVSENWTVWICDLLRDYIDAAAGVDGIPSTDDVPRFLFSDALELDDPHLHFSAVIGKRSHEYLLPITVEVRLVTQAVGDDATTEAAAIAIMQATRRRIQATPTLDAWLSALSSDTRRGWHIIAAPTMNAEADIDYDSDSGRRAISEFIKLLVHIERE